MRNYLLLMSILSVVTPTFAEGYQHRIECSLGDDNLTIEHHHYKDYSSWEMQVIASQYFPSLIWTSALTELGVIQLPERVTGFDAVSKVGNCHSQSNAASGFACTFEHPQISITTHTQDNTGTTHERKRQVEMESITIVNKIAPDHQVVKIATFKLLSGKAVSSESFIAMGCKQDSWDSNRSAR